MFVKRRTGIANDWRIDGEGPPWIDLAYQAEFCCKYMINNVRSFVYSLLLLFGAYKMLVGLEVATVHCKGPGTALW
jgi:hypothetical protein